MSVIIIIFMCFSINIIPYLQLQDVFPMDSISLQ